MLSSTFRFSVRMVPGSISAVVAPTTKSATSCAMCLCVMALVNCARAAASTTELLPVVGQTSHRSSRAREWCGAGHLPEPTIGWPERCASACFGHRPPGNRQRAPRWDGRQRRVQQRPRPHRNWIGHLALPQARRRRRGVPFRRLEDGYAQSTDMRVEGVAGHPAVVDCCDACTGVGGEFMGEPVPG